MLWSNRTSAVDWTEPLLQFQRAVSWEALTPSAPDLKLTRFWLAELAEQGAQQWVREEEKKEQLAMASTGYGAH